MQFYDVTMPIVETMPVYKNKPEKRPVFEITSNFDSGTVRETRIHLDVHTGTHIDAHLHMIDKGSTIEAISLERLIRPCRVIDLTDVSDAIHEVDLAPHSPQASEFLLFKTKNSFSHEFQMEFIYLAGDAAAKLADIGIAGGGMDALGIDRSQPEHPTHKALFTKDITVIEGLRLREVPQGQYLLVALPLALVGLDAAPARVLLFPLNENLRHFFDSTA